MVDELNGKRKCFVVTPIGKDADLIRRHINGIIDAVIMPALEDKYIINVAHRMADPGAINKQIIREIHESDLVIANLTEKNPNVMYELALRHSIGTPVIIIAEEGTSLPFDISGERTIFYINDSQGVLDLKKRLEECECTIDFDSKKRVGPIYDALREINADISIIENIEAGREEDADALKYIVKKLNELDDKVNTRLLRDSSFDITKVVQKEMLKQSDIKFSFVMTDGYTRKQLLDAITEFRSIIEEKYRIMSNEVTIRIEVNQIKVYSNEYWPFDIMTDVAAIMRETFTKNGIQLD